MDKIVKYEQEIKKDEIIDKESKIEILILRQEKKVLDHRFNVMLDENAAPKYYFADSTGRRISDYYYSINQLDNMHYVVSDLDFMYGNGFDVYESMYGNEVTPEEVGLFKFHYGVVSVVGNEVNLVVPIIYDDVSLSNSNMLFVRNEKKYTSIYEKDGKFGQNVIPSKVGCYNLDPNSDSYGMSVIPPVMDSILDFDLDYQGYALASIGDYEGYLSKEIDTERYEEFINLIATAKIRRLNPSEYFSLLGKSVKDVLYTEEEIKSKLEGKIKKKLK